MAINYPTIDLTKVIEVIALLPEQGQLRAMWERTYWLRENISGKWMIRYEGPVRLDANQVMVVLFEEIEDAMAFKLRWAEF